MRTHGGLKKWPITNQQRAAMREAQKRVARVLEQGVTPEQLAQCRAELTDVNRPRQSSLPLKVRP